MSIFSTFPDDSITGKLLLDMAVRISHLISQSGIQIEQKREISKWLESMSYAINEEIADESKIKPS